MQNSRRSQQNLIIDTAYHAYGNTAIPDDGMG